MFVSAGSHQSTSSSHSKSNGKTSHMAPRRRTESAPHPRFDRHREDRHQIHSHLRRQLHPRSAHRPPRLTPEVQPHTMTRKAMSERTLGSVDDPTGATTPLAPRNCSLRLPEKRHQRPFGQGEKNGANDNFVTAFLGVSQNTITSWERSRCTPRGCVVDVCWRSQSNKAPRCPTKVLGGLSP